MVSTLPPDRLPDRPSDSRPDRRARRRAETIAEILDIAVELMEREGVAGLSLSDIARRLGIQPPSLYKYFPSRLAIYDALFEAGQVQHLAIVRAALESAEPGLPAVQAALDASARWCHGHQVLAQLLFWRPAPGFEASVEAMAPSVEMVELFRTTLREAQARGELGPGADGDEGVALLSIVQAGVISQQLSNEPHATFERGRFTSMLPQAVAMFVATYPPEAAPTRRSSTKGMQR
jgi:AcrR family transcriptional regulator